MNIVGRYESVSTLNTKKPIGLKDRTHDFGATGSRLIAGATYKTKS